MYNWKLNYLVKTISPAAINFDKFYHPFHFAIPRSILSIKHERAISLIAHSASTLFIFYLCRCIFNARLIDLYHLLEYIVL